MKLAVRDPWIDSLRTLAILGVFAIHLDGSRILVATGQEWFDAFWRGFSRGGSYGVTIFFVISGFLITRILDQRKADRSAKALRAFYVGRLARIAPLFAVVVIAGAIVMSLGGLEDREGYAFCLRSQDAVFDWKFWLSFPTLSFNWIRIANESRSFGYGLHWDVLWSLAIEEQFYLVYPILIYSVRSPKTRLTLLAGVIASGPIFRALCYTYHPQSFLWGFTSTFACIDQLALGSLVYWGFARDQRTRLISKWMRLALGGLSFLGAAWVYCKTRTWIGLDRIWAPSAIALGVAGVLAATQAGGGQNRTERRPWVDHMIGILTMPGRLSYGCYLWHGAVLLAIWPVVKGMNIASAFVVFLSVVTGAAKLSELTLELPARRWIETALRES